MEHGFTPLSDRVRDLAAKIKVREELPEAAGAILTLAAMIIDAHGQLACQIQAAIGPVQAQSAMFRAMSDPDGNGLREYGALVAEVMGWAQVLSVGEGKK